MNTKFTLPAFLFFSISSLGCAPSIVYIVEDDSQFNGNKFINWTNSYNGEWILDIDNERVRFKVDGRMCYGKFPCTGNYYVNGSAFFKDGKRIGNVADSIGSNGKAIGVLKDIHGCMIDIGWNNGQVYHSYVSCNK